MKVEIKNFKLKKTLSTEAIEEAIKKDGYRPLRWAIVKADENYIYLDTVLLATK